MSNSAPCEPTRCTSAGRRETAARSRRERPEMTAAWVLGRAASARRAMAGAGQRQRLGRNAFRGAEGPAVVAGDQQPRSAGQDLEVGQQLRRQAVVGGVRLHEGAEQAQRQGFRQEGRVGQGLVERSGHTRSPSDSPQCLHENRPSEDMTQLSAAAHFARVSRRLRPCNIRRPSASSCPGGTRRRRNQPSRRRCNPRSGPRRCPSRSSGGGAGARPVDRGARAGQVQISRGVHEACRLRWLRCCPASRWWAR